VPPGQPISIEINFRLPDGFKLNHLRPPTYQLSYDGRDSLIPAELLGRQLQLEARDGKASITIPINNEPGEAKVLLSVTYAFCRDGIGGLCKVDSAKWLVPLETDSGAAPATILLETGDEEAANEGQSPIEKGAFP
jgi:hypothetical protein